MIKKLKISIRLLIRVLLPFHKHQPNRLSMLNLPTIKGQQALDLLAQYNDNAHAALKITAQTMVLQHHLSQLFNTQILIVHNIESVFNIGLSADGEHTFVLVGLNAHSEPFILIPLLGEASGSISLDFRIIAPPSVSIGELTAEVNKYRLAGKRFDITN